MTIIAIQNKFSSLFRKPGLPSVADLFRRVVYLQSKMALPFYRLIIRLSIQTSQNIELILNEVMESIIIHGGDKICVGWVIIINYSINEAYVTENFLEFENFFQLALVTRTVVHGIFVQMAYASRIQNGRVFLQIFLNLWSVTLIELIFFFFDRMIKTYVTYVYNSDMA